MQSLLAQWRSAQDPRATFLRCYHMMTTNVVAALEKGRFYDPPWVAHLVHHFAIYYFSALDKYEQARTKTPAVWLHTFKRTSRPGQSSLQNLMLGVNAHINYDLVLALVDMLQPEWDSLSAEGRQHRYGDHCQINSIIGATIDGVQDQIIEPGSKRMAMADAALGPIDEWLTSRLITHWREEVWLNALHLLAESDRQERDKHLRLIERKTLKRAKAIALQDGFLNIPYLL